MEPLLAAKIGAALLLASLSLTATSFLVRKLVDLIIVVICLGAIAGAVGVVYTGAATTWEEVAGESILFGVAAGLVSTFLTPLSSLILLGAKSAAQKQQLPEAAPAKEMTESVK